MPDGAPSPPEGKDVGRRYRPERVEEVVAGLALKAGVQGEDAWVFARALVDADVRGLATHGVSRLDIYLRRIERGLIDPGAGVTVTQVRPAALSVDAGGGLGHVQGVKVLELLVPIAREHGVAAATVRRSQHFGALAYYCARAAERDMVLLAMTNCEPAMPPFGANEPYFGTNPIAVAFPTGLGFPISVDLSTSVVARGNIIAAARAGKEIPAGWALDASGAPTTDAGAALEGAVLTMAAHKGAALALMVEAFAGVLSGSAIGREVGSMYKELSRPQDVGHFFCLFDIAAFLELDVWRARIDRMATAIRALRRAEGVDEVLLPGEGSHRRAIENRSEGIRLDPRTLEELDRLCHQYGVPRLAGS